MEAAPLPHPHEDPEAVIRTNAAVSRKRTLVNRRLITPDVAKQVVQRHQGEDHINPVPRFELYSLGKHVTMKDGDQRM